MCEQKDAERYEYLAEMQGKENEIQKARKNYLEAASIYVLEAERRKDDSLLSKANGCYRKSRAVNGHSTDREFTKQELARLCLTELDDIEKKKKMCERKEVKTLIELAKSQERIEPEKAAKNYFKAAEQLLQASEHHPEKEDEYVNMANKIYSLAKELKRKKAPAKFDDQFRQAEIVKRTKNNVTFKEIGGLENLKEEIRFKIIEPFKNPKIFKYYNKPIGGGILMYGPPGCGKSLIAQATANEANANFIHVKSSDLKSKFVGETEKNIAELFEKAREKQPTIIFFDEFESLGGDRAEGHSHEKSAVAQLLTEMDGVGTKDQKILLLAATNEPWSIDPALRREGRFGKTIFVPQPDFEARKQIFEIVMSRKPAKGLDCLSLAKLTDGLSGADIKGICESATDFPLKECLNGKKMRKIHMADMQKAVKVIESQSVMKQWFKKAKLQVEKNKLEDSFKELVKEKVVT